MEQKKPVYICSPLSAPSREGILRNMMAAREYMRKVSLELGRRAIAPHAWLPELLDDSVWEERELALRFDTQALHLCESLIICHPEVTRGMAMEIELAQGLGLPILARPAAGEYDSPKSIPEVGIKADWGAWGY